MVEIRRYGYKNHYYLSPLQGSKKSVKVNARRKIPVTVCIAAIYNNSSILGISDRMVTAGDIEFEPPQTKIFNITSSIAIMIAGDYNLQTQVYLSANSEIQNKISANPKKWFSVKEAAIIFRDIYLEIKKDLAEKAILFPLGLTYKSFLEQQKSMSSEHVESIIYDLKNYSIPTEGIQTIVTGVDEEGAHIYTITDGEISCDDLIGFSAIGSGSNHALSHLMVSRYTRFVLEPTAVLTIHQAKKKAEISPGVGEETDMFIIGGLGQFMMIYPIPGDLDIVKDLDRFYEDYKKGINKENKKAEENIKKYLTEISKTSPVSDEDKENTELPSKESKSQQKPDKSSKAQSHQKLFKEKTNNKSHKKL